jgi:enoyl-CoA hydratase
MATDLIQYSQEESVAVIRLDDGKANALSPAMIAAIGAALDRAEREAGAVLLYGRERRLSAGFDLAVMTRSVGDARQLVLSGAELLLRLYLFPRPVVVACTGHALAAGALLLLSADRRIGVEGDFKIGLNEVAIQMPLPIFGMELARDRLAKSHFTAATTQATIYDPQAACAAGYLDQVTTAERLAEEAGAIARQLATLPNPAFRLTKERERQRTVRRIRESLVEDIATLIPPRP